MLTSVSQHRSTRWSSCRSRSLRATTSPLLTCELYCQRCDDNLILTHRYSIQLVDTISPSNCAGAPQRVDGTQPAPDGLALEPFHSPDQIFAWLADASQGEFDKNLKVWLLVSRTVAAVNNVNPAVPGPDTQPVPTTAHGVSVTAVIAADTAP